MKNQFIKNESNCTGCNTFMMLVTNTRGKDGYAWRCMSTECDSYKKYFSIRKNSFFNDFNLEFVEIFRIIEKYISRQPQHSIISSMSSVSRTSIQKVLKKISNLILSVKFSHNKLGF